MSVTANSLVELLAVFQTAVAAGETFTTSLNFSSDFSDSGITSSQFIALAELDALTSQNLISDKTLLIQIRGL